MKNNVEENLVKAVKEGDFLIVGELSEEEFNNFLDMFLLEENRRALSKVKSIQESHKEYIGKCYKTERYGKEFYFKVLGEVSSNEYHMECLCFYGPLKWEYKPVFRKQSNGSNEATLNCTPFFCEGLPLFTSIPILKFSEVLTEEQFNAARDSVYSEMCGLMDRKDLSDELMSRKETVHAKKINC